MGHLGKAIEAAAAQQGLTVRKFRARWRMPNTYFYRLKKGYLPATVAARAKWKKRLENAGVVVNGAL